MWESTLDGIYEYALDTDSFGRSCITLRHIRTRQIVATGINGDLTFTQEWDEKTKADIEKAARPYRDYLEYRRAAG